MCSFSYLNFNFTNFWLMELIDFIPYKFTYTIKVESRKRGNLELAATDNFEIDAIFLERRSRGRGKKNEAKKLRRQKTKKSKHILKMVS